MCVVGFFIVCGVYGVSNLISHLLVLRGLGSIRVVVHSWFRLLPSVWFVVHSVTLMK
jgi:hypothetical protein